MTTRRWVFEDLERGDSYDFPVNPNSGGSAVPEKSMAVEVTYSPEINGVLQQGDWGVPTLGFSGAIYTQEQDEAMEAWALRQTSIKLTDDLGRAAIGVLTSFTRTRSRRINNPWFSTYDAEFQAIRQLNASGDETWNRTVPPPEGDIGESSPTPTESIEGSA